MRDPNRAFNISIVRVFSGEINQSETWNESARKLALTEVLLN
uniref:Uncharacterized protein n=1 Tax=Anguilla anguilla TaxID=7936 RepID=A0A0E9SRU7_ANGAN